MFQVGTPPLFPARGFTLQETLVSLLIGGTLVSGGAGLHTVVRESAKTAAANELMAHLALARSEAITRRTSVSMCPSRDRLTCLKPESGHTVWQHGWLLYADSNDNGKPEPAEILSVGQPLSGDLVVRTSRARRDVTYQPSGMAGGSTITFALCDARGAKFARYVTVNNTGRPRASRTTESNMRCT